MKDSFFGLVFGSKIKSNAVEADFVEEGEREAGFAEFYSQKIKSDNIRLENIRVKNLKYLILSSRISLILGIILTIFTFIATSSEIYQVSTKQHQDLFRNIVLGVFIILIIWPSIFTIIYKNAIKSDLFKNIFSFFGEFIYEPGGSKSLGSYEQFQLLPAYDVKFSTSEDYVVGTYKGVNISFEEACLQKETRTKQGTSINFGKVHLGRGAGGRQEVKTEVKFKGILITLSFNKNFKGRTIVRTDRKIDNLVRGVTDSLERVELEDPEFEKMFQVYSQDQVEARYLLTTSFMERLKSLSVFFESERTEASFYENKVLLTFVGTQNLFEPRSIFEQTDLVKECKNVIAQMGLIFDVIDHLKLDQRTGL
ncbi:MAG: DUF3137 domain-containing protein [Rickettsiales bacterium]|nr:DUF3137 domain-containing protein [Rickettsiales bacterium]